MTQPLQPATVAVDGKKFSDLWMRAVIGNTTPTVHAGSVSWMPRLAKPPGPSSVSSLPLTSI